MNTENSGEDEEEELEQHLQEYNSLSDNKNLD